MRIIVTGAAGFIGSNLCEKLISLNYEVVGIDNFDPFYNIDIKKKNIGFLLKQSSFSFIEGDLCAESTYSVIGKADLIIHLAAKAGVRPSLEKPIEYLNNNILSTNLLLEFSKKNKITKFIFASSSSVYGNRMNIPFLESDDVNNPISPYAFSKRSCELLNYCYHINEKIDFINFRFFTVYGPRQRPDLAIYKFFKLISNNQPIIIYGDGNSARDYTYVSDTVAGIVNGVKYLEKNSNVFETINLGNSSPITLNTLISGIEKVTGKTAIKEFVSMQKGEVELTYADINKGKYLIGYDPQIKLENGLKEMFNWYLNEVDKIK